MSRLLVALAWGVVAVPLAASAVTIRVPDHAATIQSAISLASPSQVDTVLVAPGTYFERPYIVGKHVVLRGQAGAENTIVHGSQAGNVLTVNFVSRNCIIEDLTFTGGKATSTDSVGAGIYLNQASPTIQRCRLVDNESRSGGGLAAYVHCEPLIKDCWVAHNIGGGIYIELGRADQGTTWGDIVNTVVVRNTGNGVFVWKGARVRLTNCTIAHNAADGITSNQLGRVAVENCLVAFNGGGGVVRLDPTVCYRPMGCNDVYMNAGGNYLGTNPGDSCYPGRGSGDVSIDPCFQNADADNYHLQRTSPLCTLREPGACGVIGAYEDPCSGIIGNCVVSVTPATWTRVKGFYR